jgi:hypothetical protein
VFSSIFSHSPLCKAEGRGQQAAFRGEENGQHIKILVYFARKEPFLSGLMKMKSDQGVIYDQIIFFNPLRALTVRKCAHAAVSH